MNSQGIPSLKELFKGVLIDCDSTPNRHLRQAGLDGRVLHLELIEVPASLEDEEEYAEEEVGEEEEGEETYDPYGLAPTNDEDDEDVEQCDDYPNGCATCEDLECGHEVDDAPEDELLDVELRVTLLWPDLGGDPQRLDEEEIEENPALCRFLNQIKDQNDL